MKSFRDIARYGAPPLAALLGLSAQARAQDVNLSEEIYRSPEVLTNGPGLRPVPAGPSETPKRDELPDADVAANRSLAEKPDLVIAPIPISNPALGTGLGLAGVLTYNPNHSPKPWSSGLGGAYTSTGSWGVGAFHNMSLAQGAIRLGAVAGYVDAKVKFYGIGADAGEAGVYLDLRNKGFGARLDTQFRLSDHGFFGKTYLGARLGYIHVRSAIGLPDPDRPDLSLPDIELKSKVAALGPLITIDSRDNDFNPRKGVFVNVSWLLGAPFLGSDFTHHKFEVAGNTYFTLGKNTVLGVRKTLCSISGDAPYYDLCLYGMTSDLRGYEAGRYRDRASWALQAEIRQHLWGKFGFVAFVGIGGIAESAKHIFKNTTLLPSGGLGLRYLASKRANVNLRLDLAYGKDGAAVYFGIGEAF